MFLAGRQLAAPWGGNLRHGGIVLVRLGGITLWSLALAAVVLLPFFELVQFGNRGATTDLFINYGRLEWTHLWSCLLPAAIAARRAHEYNWFLGPGLLLAGVAGLARWRHREGRGLLILAGFALLLALGDQTPLYPIFKYALPGMTSFRLHARAGLLFTFALVLGATLVWPFVCMPFAAKAATVRTLKLGLAALILCPLVWNAWQARREYSYYGFFSEEPEFRIQTALRAALPAAAPDRPPARVAFPWRGLVPNRGMLDGYADCDAYTSLFLQRPWECLHVLASVPPPDLDRTALALKSFATGPFPFTGAAQQFGYDSTNQIVVTNPRAEPRAWFASAATGPLTYPEILARLHDGHDQQSSPLIEEGLPLTFSADASPPLAVKFHRFRNNEIQLEVAAPRDGLLVLAEAWHPGWQAEVGGKVIDAVPVNGWMRAFPLPAGQHQVRVFYEQNLLWQGVIISLGAIGAALYFGWRIELTPPAPSAGASTSRRIDPAPLRGSPPRR